MGQTFEISSGRILERIVNPLTFFKNNPLEFKSTVQVVRDAFGTPMTEEDIYQHLTMPGKVYLLRDSAGILGMCSYTPKKIAGRDLLFVDGIAIDPKRQAQGIFGEVTQIASEQEEFLALKTQNPRMYRALEKFCGVTYPNESLVFPEDILPLMKNLAQDLKLNVDKSMVARGFYGTSLYPKMPVHRSGSRLFDNILQVNYSRGDSVLCLGVKR